MKKANVNTNVVCPVYGAEFAIAEHEHKVKNATVVGKDSGLGTVKLPLANKADERLAALKNAGVDTTGLFAMQSASGEGMIVRLKNGIPTVVENDDPIFASILAKGTIPDRGLFRRWVMSQMFHMLSEKDYYGTKRTFTEAIHRKGYDYTWKMLEEELRVQAKLFKNDPENFIQRNRWFNTDTVIAMISHDIEQTELYVKNLTTRLCKGIPYKQVHGRNIFVSDLQTKLYWPLRRCSSMVRNANTPAKLYEAVKEYNARRVKLPWNTTQCAAWVDAYKGSGAYYTLKNLILFHGCVLTDQYGVKFSKESSLKFLESKANEYRKEGWRLFGVLKKALDDNNIDIEKKIKEWRKK